MQRVETCEQCRFDSRDWTVQDLAGTLQVLGPWWRELLRWVDPALVSARPAPTTWSALEYVAHSRDVTFLLGHLLHAVLTVDGLELPGVHPPEARADDPPLDIALDGVIDELEGNASRLARRAATIDPKGWSRTAVVAGAPLDAADVLAHAVHDATHHLMDVGRGLHALGAPPATATGTVAQLNVSSGGVPKLPVATARIGKRGIEGDRQATRRHHGRPWQALCLWSAEAIARLQGEGHPIEAGAAGENVTVAGLEWAEIRPGVRLQVGEAVIEASLYALPCNKNARWFVDGDFGRMEHTRERGISRIYAWVLTDGEVHVGDAVVVEP